MSNALDRRAMRSAELASLFLALVLVGCASPSTGDGRPGDVAGEARAAEPPGTDAAGARATAPSEATLENTIDLLVRHYTERLGEITVHRRAIAGGEEITLSSPLLKGPGNEPQLLVHTGGPEGRARQSGVPGEHEP